jgi:hypothetical protein
LSNKPESISLYRTDGQLGVTFDSIETQRMLLAFVKAEDEREYRQAPGIDPENPGLRHFIAVIANGGVIPQNSKFKAMLKRKGISAWEIPGRLRAYYLVTSQKGINMQETSSDRQSDFITYLKKVSKLKDSLPPLMLEDQKKIRDLILPILEDNDGQIAEDKDSISELAQRWQMTNLDLVAKINDLWQRMIMPLSAEIAGKIVKRSAGTMRRWAREGIIHADVNDRGQWSFTREVLIDCLN